MNAVVDVEPDGWEQYYSQNPPDFSDVPLSLEQWTGRQIDPKHWLLGELLSTTSRAMLTADTGLGKTHIGFAIGLAMAAGKPFCHWAGTGHPARVLVIDGEMSVDLVQERLADAERRFGTRPEGFFCLCNEDVDMPPLDTEQGRVWLGYLIAHFGFLDFIIFDNLGTLTVGDLTTAESWLPMISFNKSLTKLKIGVLWINHTGKDASKDFGTHTRLWALDVAMIATKMTNRSEGIAVRLEFLKARQRKPSNREDFESVDLFLEGDQWTSTKAKPQAKGKPPPGFHRAVETLDNLLVDAETVTPKRDHVRVKAVQITTLRNALCDEGILTRNTKGQLDSTQRTRWSNIKRFGVTEDLWRMSQDWIWRI